VCLSSFASFVTDPETVSLHVNNLNSFELNYCVVIIVLRKQNVFAVFGRFEMWSLILREDDGGGDD
jgi:hypothetical protein